MHNNSQGQPPLLYNQQWPPFMNQGFSNQLNHFSQMQQPMMPQPQYPQSLMASSNFTPFQNRLPTSLLGHGMPPTTGPPPPQSSSSALNPAPRFGQSNPNGKSGVTPLMSVNSAQSLYGHSPAQQKSPNQQASQDSSSSKERQFKYKVNRYDSTAKSLDQFIEDYIGEKLEDMTNGAKKKRQDVIDNIEIQTTDFNHGLTPCFTKTTTLNENVSSETSNNNKNESKPPSLLSLKIPNIGDNNGQLQKKSDAPKNNPKSALFPILDHSSQETKVSNQPKLSQNKSILIEEILHKPGRDRRPHKIVIFIRGPPGSGKSFLANLIKQEEEKFVSESEKPKLLSIDNYFITEQENPSSKQILMKYEYDKSMDESYQRSLVKSFKKTVDDDLFSFIIVDMINDKMAKIDDMNLYAKMKGFQTYVVELNKGDADACFCRNVHNRKLHDIQQIIAGWEILPSSYVRLDVSKFFNQSENQEIEYVDMDENESANEGARANSN